MPRSAVRGRLRAGNMESLKKFHAPAPYKMPAPGRKYGKFEEIPCPGPL